MRTCARRTPDHRGRPENIRSLRSARTPTCTRIASFGRVKVPVFKIVDSVDAAPFDAIVAEERGGAAFMPASVLGLDADRFKRFRRTAAPPPITEAPEGPAAPEGLDELSDEIPF